MLTAKLVDLASVIQLSVAVNLGYSIYLQVSQQHLTAVRAMGKRIEMAAELGLAGTEFSDKNSGYRSKLGMKLGHVCTTFENRCKLLLAIVLPYSFFTSLVAIFFAPLSCFQPRAEIRYCGDDIDYAVSLQLHFNLAAGLSSSLFFYSMEHKKGLQRVLGSY